MLKFNKNFYDSNYINYFYDLSYVNKFPNMKQSIFYNNKNYKFTQKYFYRNYTTTQNKFNNYYNYQLTNYTSKIIDETHNHNDHENKYLRFFVPSMMFIYITYSIVLK
jgi:hypothetical protein